MNHKIRRENGNKLTEELHSSSTCPAGFSIIAGYRQRAREQERKFQGNELLQLPIAFPQGQDGK